MNEPVKRGPGRPRKTVAGHGSGVSAEALAALYAPKPEPTPIPPGPLVLEVRLGPPGQGKIIFSQRVYAHTIDQQAHQAVITGALRPNQKSDV